MESFERERANSINLQDLLAQVRSTASEESWPKAVARPGPPVLETEGLEPESRVLVISLHHDDELLGCGGTMARYARDGAHIKVAYLPGTVPNCDAGCQTLSRTLSSMEIEGRLRALGCFDCLFIGFAAEEGRRDQEAEAWLLAALNDFVPHKIFVPFPEDGPASQGDFVRIFAKALSRYHGEVECYCYEVWTALRPNVLIDMTDTLEVKLEALRGSEVVANPAGKIRGLNEYRSFAAGRQAKYCEAFYKCSRERYLQMAWDIRSDKFGE